MLTSLKNAAQGMHPAVKIGLLIATVAVAWYVVKNYQGAEAE